MGPEKSWTRADSQFLVGAILALLIWGLQLIGVTVNLWLGAGVLALAFIFMTRAFWVWEGPSRWHVTWRVVTVGLAAVIYITAVGWQIRAEWIMEHPKTAIKNTSEQSPSSDHPQPQAPTTQESPKKKTARQKPSPPPSASITTGRIEQGACSNLQIGGSGNQTVNCGPPDPTLRWTQEQKQSESNPPEAFVTLSVDHSLEVPAFAALCDRPCESRNGDIAIDGMHGEDLLTIKGNPNATGFELKFPRPLGAGVKVYWRIRSKDEKPVHVLEVRKIVFSELPK